MRAWKACATSCKTRLTQYEARDAGCVLKRFGLTEAGQFFILHAAGQMIVDAQREGGYTIFQVQTEKLVVAKS
jgi:hypothetical protein